MLRLLLAPLLLLLLLLLSVFAADDARAAESRVSIGVLVLDGEPDALERWSATADYLSRHIPPHRFVIVPLDREGMRRAVAHDELDFILTNPSQYVELAATNGITALATMKYPWEGKYYAETSAVIVVRADRKDIRGLTDLKGKSFMAVSPDAFDGFQLINWEFRSHGINPSRDFGQLVFSKSTQEQIVYAVRNRTVDAATVRTGVLERLAREGKVELKEFRVLHQHDTPLEFPFVASSELYPERPFARSRKAPDQLAQRVASALKAMPANHPAARAAGNAGWTTAGDYQPVAELLAGNHKCPYADTSEDTIADVIREHRSSLLPGFALLLLLAATTTYSVRLNHRLRGSKDRMEAEIIERKRVQQQLRRSERTLRVLHEISSLHELPFAGKIQALLSFGCKQFGLPVGILSHVRDNNYEVQEVVAPDQSIPRGAIFLLSHTFCYNTLQAAGPLAFEHAGGSSWRTHPAYGECQLEAYLGIRVEVNATVYGTLNFVSTEPRLATFTDGDKDILRSMAHWVGSEIERQQMEAQMRKLSVALEQTADAVAIVARDGAIEYVNPAFERITGYSRDEALGRTPGLLRSGRHDAEFYRSLWDTVLRGEVFSATLINRRKDGSLYYEEKSITPLKDAAGQVTCFVSTGKDVTRRTLAEEQARYHQAELAHVCRVSAMGEMAAALAHEINQPLAAIVNYAQGGLHRLRAGDANPAELQVALEHIAALGKQSGEIIRRLRGFLRKGNPQRTGVDINTIVREAVELANVEARQKDVTLHLELASDLPPVLADTIQIEQVVLNLLLNAIESIDAARCPRRWVTIHTARSPYNGVDVLVRDTGPGLPPGDAERIFEPFFTTKPDGMGMGLCISRSIIETYGEQLQAMASPDGGAAFHFNLPAIEAEGVS
jgi:PAS domain S-box-containing protein